MFRTRIIELSKKLENFQRYKIRLAGVNPQISRIGPRNFLDRPFTLMRTDRAVTISKICCIFVFTFTLLVDLGSALAQYKIEGETCNYPDPNAITHVYIPSPSTCDYVTDPMITQPPRNKFNPWNVNGQFLDNRPPEEKYAFIPVEDRPTGPPETLVVAVEGAMPFGKIELKYPDIFDEKDIPDVDLESTITVVVTDQEGETVPGRLHLRQISSKVSSKWFHIFWRSETVLQASTQYSVVVTLDNKAVAPCPKTGHIENVDIQFDVKTRDSLTSSVTPVVIEDVALNEIVFGRPRNALPQTCCSISAQQDDAEAKQICWQTHPKQSVNVSRKTAFHTLNRQPVSDYILPGKRYLVDVETKELSDENAADHINTVIFAEQLAGEYCVVETAYDIIANEQLVSEPFCKTNESYDNLISDNASNLSKIDECINATGDEKAAAKILLDGAGYLTSDDPQFNNYGYTLKWQRWISETDANEALEALIAADSPHCDYEDAEVISVADADKSAEKQLNENGDGKVSKGADDDNSLLDPKTLSDSSCDNSVGTSIPLSSLFLFMLWIVNASNRGRRRQLRRRRSY